MKILLYFQIGTNDKQKRKLSILEPFHGYYNQTLTCKNQACNHVSV